MFTLRTFKVVIPLVVSGFFISTAHANVTLLDRDNGTPLLNNLKLQIGGSIRLGQRNSMGSSDDGSYKHTGYSDSTRYHVSASYYLPDDWKLVGYYEFGNNYFHDLGWNRHTKDDDDYTNRRYLYVGVSNKKYGTLTWGKQNSVFYDAVGSMTDQWVMDMYGQGPGMGIDGDGGYDASYRARNIIKYTHKVGDFKLYASWILPDNNYYKSHFIYRRKSGGSLGLDYKVAPSLHWAIAYSYNQASMRDTKTGGSTLDHQQMLGTGLSWEPGRWHFAAIVGMYRDFIPREEGKKYDYNYFQGSAYGWEGYAAYTIPVHYAFVRSVKPYAGTNAMRWGNYETNYYYLGLDTKMRYGFELYIEHQFTNTSSKDPDITAFRLKYNF